MLDLFFEATPISCTRSLRVALAVCLTVGRRAKHTLLMFYAVDQNSGSFHLKFTPEQTIMLQIDCFIPAGSQALCHSKMQCLQTSIFFKFHAKMQLSGFPQQRQTENAKVLKTLLQADAFAHHGWA